MIIVVMISLFLVNSRAEWNRMPLNGIEQCVLDTAIVAATKHAGPEYHFDKVHQSIMKASLDPLGW
jgi:hypothetical protein